MKFNGKLLQTIRSNYGLSRQNLAEIIPDVSTRHAVARWERGEKPRLDVISCMINIFPELRSDTTNFGLLCYDELLEQKIEEARQKFAEKVG